MANSTAMITDMETVKAAVTDAQRTRAIAASGPITDLDGVMALLITKLDEMKLILNYVLYGNQAATGVEGSSSALVQTADTNHATLLTIYNNLS